MSVVVQKPYSAFIAAPVDVIPQPDFPQFEAEIVAAGLSVALAPPGAVPYDITVPDVGIWFVSSPTVGDQILLDAVVAAHTGTGLDRSRNTHSHLFSGAPGISDDDTVLGVTGLQKYFVGDIGIDTVSSSPVNTYVAVSVATGAAAWELQNAAAGGSKFPIPTAEASQSVTQSNVSTSYGIITWNSSDVAHLDGFWSFTSSSTWTCLKECRTLFSVMMDIFHGTGSAIAGLRVDIRRDSVSRFTVQCNVDNNADDDDQLSIEYEVDFDVGEEFEVFCQSYTTGSGRVSVDGDTNRINLFVSDEGPF